MVEYARDVGDDVENGEYDVEDDANAKSYLDSALVTLAVPEIND